MSRAARHIRLEGSGHSGTVRFLSGLHVNLGDGKTTSVVTVTRTGKFKDPRYGEFAITREMLLAMVSNFDQRVYGQDVFIDVAHNSAGGSAGKIIKLMVEGDRLRAQVEWTPYGVSAVKDKGYQYLSAEYHENWEDNETGASHGPVLLGAALTVRPVIKRLDPIQLSEDGSGDHPILLHPELLKTLNEEISQMKDKYLKLLAAMLAKFGGLTDAMIKTLSEGFAAALEGITEDAKAQALLASFTDAGKQLAEQIQAAAPGSTIQLSVGGGLGPDDVKRLLVEADTARVATAKQLADAKAANVKIFSDLLTAATGLTDAARKQLGEAADMITAEMSADQVRRLAEHQIKLGDSMAVSSQLSSLGYSGAQGSPRISVDESNEVRALQEEVDKRLFGRMPTHQRYQLSGGAVIDGNKQIVEAALAVYDQQNARRLHEECRRHKQLAGGDSVVSDTAIPAIFERTVIRESLYQMVALGLCDVGTAAFSAVLNLPYSFRDTGAAGRSSTRKYEGQGVLRAAVKQALEEARPIPQKIAFEVSDELRYLVGNGQIDFDIVAENARNAARIIGEDSELLIFDEHLNAADQYAATAVVDEAVATADGTKKTFVLDNFPVVRPKNVYDLQGAQVGSTLYPIVVKSNAVVRAEYDGTGTQAAGVYYTINYNLGEITFVSELGVATPPTNTHAIVASYSYTTNVHKWDSDLGSVAVEKKYNDFLYRFGLRKVAVEDRAYMPNIGLMSGTLRSQIEQADQFGANFKRQGTDLMADGNLGRIKDVPTFRSYAPGLAIGDQRVVIGERGTVRYRMLKPWTLGELENQKDGSGRFTGKKEAYGDQFIVVHTPSQLKGALTSMVVYSATARVDR